MQISKRNLPPQPVYCMQNDRRSQKTHTDGGALSSVDTMVSTLSNKAPPLPQKQKKKMKKNPDLRRTVSSPPLPGTLRADLMRS